MTIALEELPPPPLTADRHVLPVTGGLGRLAGWAPWLLLSAPLPYLVLLLRDAQERTHQSLAPVIIAAACWLLWGRLRERSPAADGTPPSTAPRHVRFVRDIRDAMTRPLPALVELAFLAAALLLAGGVALHSCWLAMLAWVIAMGGVLKLAGGPTLGPWALLWLALPIPLQGDAVLMRRLQGMSAEFSSLILDLLRIEHVREGSLLVMADRTLLIEEACSGMTSLLTLTACAAFWCVLQRRTLLAGLLVTASAPMWAVAANVVRIGVIACSTSVVEVDLSTGTAHDVLGVATFLAALTGVAVWSWLLQLLGSPILIEDDTVAGETLRRNPLIAWWNGGPLPTLTALLDPEPEPHDAEPAPQRALWSGTWRRGVGASTPALATGIVLAAFAVRGGTLLWPASPALSLSVDPRLPAAAAAFQPAPPAGWTFSELAPDAAPLPESAASRHNSIWRLEAPGFDMHLGLDFPHGEWHDLVVCYQILGWTVDESSIRRPPSGAAYQEVILSRPSGERGMLLYGMIAADGRDVPPEGGSLRDRLHARLRRSFRSQDRQALYEIQAFVTTTGGVLDGSVRSDAESAFDSLRKTVRGALQGPQSPRPATLAESPDEAARR